jgi:hypothetical protein
MTQKRFARLTNGFSKKLTNHAAAVSLYVTHYNLCRVDEALRTTPAVALGIADRVWTIGDLLTATLAIEPNRPVRVTRKFTVIDGGTNRMLVALENHEISTILKCADSPPSRGCAAHELQGLRRPWGECSGAGCLPVPRRQTYWKASLRKRLAFAI